MAHSFVALLYWVKCNLMFVRETVEELVSRFLFDVFGGLFCEACPGSVEYFRLKTERLSKKPMHIGIIVDEKNLLYEELAKVVWWSMFSGIKFITLLDFNGNLARNLPTLAKAIRQQEHLVGKTHASEFPYQLSTPSSFSTTTTSTPTASLGTGFEIRVVTPSDGRQDMAVAARRLCEAVGRKELQPRQINKELVYSSLDVLKGFPEPDLLLKFDESYVLAGYLPWHLHLTEILHIKGGLRHIRSTRFMSALYAFSDVSQRFGR